MNIVLNGANGHMGRIIRRLVADSADMEIAACVDAAGGEGCLTRLDEYGGPADCLLDFSHRDALEGVLEFCLKRKLPAVIATTGHTEAQRAAIKAASAQIPVFFSPTMSPAVAMLARMAAQAAAAFPEADVEIVERHHNRKVDVPSGTALLFARAIQAARGGDIVIGRHENGRRGAGDIAIHSLRMGNECGTHTIIISTNSQTLTFEHRAENRELFAEGALQAVRFTVGRGAGLYTMDDAVNG